MRRRSYLRGVGLAGAALTGASAGCLSLDESPTALPPALEDPPTAVYRPTHVSGMALVGTAEAGPFRFGLLYSYPDRFWEVVGRTTYLRGVEESDAVHLMAAVWDPETGLVLPEVGLTTEILQDDELVAEEAVYAMVSQRMGFHYGDNFALPGDGDYTVRVSVGGVQIRRTGAFEGRFDDPASVELPFRYRATDRNALDRRRLDDAGTPGAIEPMTAPGVPNAVAPPVESLPGRHLGRVSTGDAVLDALVLHGDAAARFDADAYLAVVARTPHSGMLLPSMGLDGRLERDGEQVAALTLKRTLDPELGYHYGRAVPGVESGDELVLAPTTPPQIARHEGYETAFVEMPEAPLTVE